MGNTSLERSDGLRVPQFGIVKFGPNKATIEWGMSVGVAMIIC